MISDDAIDDASMGFGGSVGAGDLQGSEHAALGQLEHLVHNLFANDRLSGGPYVYHTSTELFNALDDFCDEEAMVEPRQPLVVAGERGSGKSALLANWYARRQRNAPTRMRQGDEFVFWHTLGCSRQSVEIEGMIRRLIRDLKKHFDLARDEPASSNRLSWELPRFLELSARKGRVVVILDGIHRIESSEGEAGLSWLPLEFPPNVRVILSVCSELMSAFQPQHLSGPASGNGGGVFSRQNPHFAAPMNGGNNSPSPKDASAPLFSLGAADSAFNGMGTNRYSAAASMEVFSISSSGKPGDSRRASDAVRIVSELERRRLVTIHIKPLDRMACRAIIDDFIRKSVQAEVSRNAGQEAAVLGAVDALFGSIVPTSGVSGTAAGGTSSGANGGVNSPSDVLPGFLLFESQVASILNHPLTCNPLFLRLLLR
jgi:hypothetical protein